jgi:hypothetical protein
MVQNKVSDPDAIAETAFFVLVPVGMVVSWVFRPVFDIFRNASGGIVLRAKSNIVIASEQNISLISKSDINFVSGNAIHGGLGYISYNPDLHSGQAEIVKALI